MHCRDDVYSKVAGFIESGCNNFYDDAHRSEFLAEIVDVPDADVLPRYVDLLESQVTP